MNKASVKGSMPSWFSQRLLGGVRPYTHPLCLLFH